ncbi:MAG TPA: hypothetical protein VGM86_04410, partial [Thermoanaerobaculia bacterium]|jgi:tetratricopeptide (TPR) repeat protein
LEEAIGEITAFLTPGQPPDIQCDALAFRAMIEEERGAIDLAREDRHQARALAPSGSYAKYTIELGMAGLYEKTGEVEEAISWYIEALKTVLDDPLTSGGSAVACLLDLRDLSALAPEHRELCLKAVHQAWALFELPGEPDLTNLREAAQTLIEASTRPLPRTQR